jgi:hypothetical protein
MAVKALPYVRCGGMNRRMAGEDFYFIQKLVPAGGYFNLNSTTVYPSPRSSSRVPFGTGVTISKMAEAGQCDFFTYNMKAFTELKTLFGMTDLLYSYDKDDRLFSYNDLPDGLKSTTDITEWSARITEIRENTSGISSFRKRFFNWFNMFRIVKYLNAVHTEIFPKRPVQECASELLAAKGIDFRSGEPEKLLEYFRGLEKNC